MFIPYGSNMSRKKMKKTKKNFLIEFLERKGLKQRELSRLLGQSSCYINFICNNRVMMSVKNLVRIREILEVSWEELGSKLDSYYKDEEELNKKQKKQKKKD